MEYPGSMPPDSTRAGPEQNLGRTPISRPHCPAICTFLQHPRATCPRFRGHGEPLSAIPQWFMRISPAHGSRADMQRIAKKCKFMQVYVRHMQHSALDLHVFVTALPRSATEGTARGQVASNSVPTSTYIRKSPSQTFLVSRMVPLAISNRYNFHSPSGLRRPFVLPAALSTMRPPARPATPSARSPARPRRS